MKSNTKQIAAVLISLTAANQTLNAQPVQQRTQPLLGQELAPFGAMQTTTGWQGDVSASGKGAKIGITTSEKHSGDTAMHVDISRNPGEYPLLKSPAFSTETGRTYRVTFWMKIVRGAVGTTRRNGANNDQRTLNAEVMNQGSWKKYTADYLELKGGDGAYIGFYAAHNNAEFYLDDFSIREVKSSAEGARAAWKTLFAKQEYAVWQNLSPWERLQTVHYPPNGVTGVKKIRNVIGRSEYESASFVVTNLSAQEQKFDIKVGKSNLAITLRQAMWITAHNGNTVNDALPLLDESLLIPAGESREIWLTLQSRGVKAGTYKNAISILPNRGTPQIIQLETQVFPVTLPEDMPIYTTYWDNVVPTWVKTPGLAREQMVDLKQHYANVAIGHPWIVPPLKVDKAGKLVEDYSELDAALENYKTLNPKLIVFNWNRGAYFEGDARSISQGLPPYMSDTWKALFKDWLRNWVKHMATKGIGYDRFVMYPEDENLLPATYEIAKLIKETDPKVKFYVNSMGADLSQAQNIAPYVDIFSPYLYDYLNIAPYDENPEIEAKAVELLKKRPEFFWTYANPLYHEPQESSPYADFRLAVWRAWHAGFSGFGYYIYTYKSHWNSYNDEEGANWAVAYLADSLDAPKGLSKREQVIPGKRWEATREGVEDYVYLDMLKKAVAKPINSQNKAAIEAGRQLLNGLPQKVLNDTENPVLASRGKEEILRILSKISPN